MRIVAIVMVRNGVDYVENCITHLLSNNIEVAIIDHGSDDGTWEACEKYLSHGLCHLSYAEYEGVFSLSKQLVLKQSILNGIVCDWVVHQDIDECLLSSPSFEGDLCSEIKHADDMGFNTLNFDEFVFLPYDLSECSYNQSQFYYFFEPRRPRLMRAWKKSDALSSLNSGGHVLSGCVQLYPSDGVLKHYIFTSQQHAYDKYQSRLFASNELEKGWHRNRVGIDKASFAFPNKSQLQSLSETEGQLSKQNPWKKHYWDI